MKRKEEEKGGGSGCTSGHPWSWPWPPGRILPGQGPTLTGSGLFFLGKEDPGVKAQPPQPAWPSHPQTPFSPKFLSSPAKILALGPGFRDGGSLGTG